MSLVSGLGFCESEAMARTCIEWCAAEKRTERVVHGIRSSLKSDRETWFARRSRGLESVGVRGPRFLTSDSQDGGRDRGIRESAEESAMGGREEDERAVRTQKDRGQQVEAHRYLPEVALLAAILLLFFFLLFLKLCWSPSPSIHPP